MVDLIRVESFFTKKKKITRSSSERGREMLKIKIQYKFLRGNSGIFIRLCYKKNNNIRKIHAEKKRL